MSENGEKQKEKENNSSYCSEVVSCFSLTNSDPNLFKNYPSDSKSNKSNDSKADPSKAFEKTVEAINNLASKFEGIMTSMNNSIKSQNEFNSNLASKLDTYIDAQNKSNAILCDNNSNLASKLDTYIDVQNKSNANLCDKFDQTLTAINSSISIQNNLLTAIKELIDKKIK